MCKFDAHLIHCTLNHGYILNVWQGAIINNLPISSPYNSNIHRLSIFQHLSVIEVGSTCKYLTQEMKLLCQLQNNSLKENIKYITEEEILPVTLTVNTGLLVLVCGAQEPSLSQKRSKSHIHILLLCSFISWQKHFTFLLKVHYYFCCLLKQTHIQYGSFYMTAMIPIQHLSRLKLDSASLKNGFKLICLLLRTN